MLHAVTGVVTAAKFSGDSHLGSIGTSGRGGWLEFDPPGLLTIGSPQFAVVSGPCTVADHGRCVGRRDGYLPNEQCEITVSGGYGALGQCLAFNIADTDRLTLPSGRVVNLADCPVGLILAPGQTLAWTSDGSCQGWTDVGSCSSDSELGGGG